MHGPYQRKRRPRTARCARCKAKIKVRPKGRVPIFCSRNCRQRAYEHNKALGPTPVMNLLARDLATIQVRDAIRAEVWTILRPFLLQLGFDLGPDPPTPPAKPERKRHLRLIPP